MSMQSQNHRKSTNVICSSQKSQLLDTIANMNWIDLPQEAKLKRQALIEKIKRPISVDINGYFEVRKGNVLPVRISMYVPVLCSVHVYLKFSEFLS